VLLIGASPLSRALIDRFSRWPAYEVVGVIAERNDPAQLGKGLPILGTMGDFDRILQRTSPDLIVVAPAQRRGYLPIKRLLECLLEEHIDVVDGAALYERLVGAIEVSALSPGDILFAREYQLSRWRVLATRALGLVVSAIGLVLFAPLSAIAAIAIKLEDPRGSILFVQDRMGAFGRPFRLYKFRTMRPLQGVTSEWVRDNNARITRVGAILRKFRLDELPQLINVLKGDMNLVGPRPHPVGNSELLTVLARNLSDVSGIDIPYYALRCRVRPGITGWAQVRYGYANNFVEELEKLRYDLYYVKHLSLRLDIRILFETIHVIVFGHDSSVLERQARPVRMRSIVPRGLARRFPHVTG
jgi:lipopolysaccharide/colanic/teichoic acid biosynthesis glycosyltransferase